MRWIAPILLLTPLALAQPQPIPVELALAMTRDAYRAGAVADRVAVTFTDAQGRRATDRLVVRIDVTAPSPIVALDLDRLHVSITRGKLIATHDAEATTCWTADVPDPVTPEAIQATLPPLPIPQLALALSSDGSLTTPYTPAITWRLAEIDNAARPPSLTLTGRAGDAPVTLKLDPTTGHIRTFEVHFAPDKDAAALLVQCSAFDPGRSADWVIDVGARRPVGKLAELTTPPRDLLEGDVAPDLKAFSLDLEPWTIHEAVGEAEQAHPIAIIAFRGATEDLRADQIRRDVIGAQESLARELEQSAHPSLTVHAVTVVDLSETDLDAIRALATRWVNTIPTEQFDSTLRWTSDSAHAIDAFVPGTDAILLVIRADRQLAGFVPLDSASDDPPALDERIATLLARLPAADPPAPPPDPAQENGEPTTDPPGDT